jgi:predicted MFS family arabinose efflux permease
LGILNGIYGGIGQSLGSLIGGELSRNFGIQKAFYYCAFADIVILACFSFYQLIVKLSSKISTTTVKVDK